MNPFDHLFSVLIPEQGAQGYVESILGNQTQ